MKHATTVNHKRIGIETRLHAKCEILLQLLVKTVLDMPGSHELAVLSEEWGIVDGEEHAHCRLVHGNRRKRLRILVIRNGVADLEAV